jgi:hypothetical protein
MKQIRYILPKTKNFREERPHICWEHMYGWMDGYGMLFDPLVFSMTGSIPEWENGFEKNIREDDFIITSCAQASALFEDITESSRLSEKEKISTPVSEIYYPFGLPYDRYKPSKSNWLIGENSAIAKSGKSTFIAFELFSMIGAFCNEMPEERLNLGADLLVKILGEYDFNTLPEVSCLKGSDMRIDFQAYGLNRLFIQWLLCLKGKSKAKVTLADQAYLKAIKKWKDKNEKEAQKELTCAFEELAKVRQDLSGLEVRFLEYPHLGILFEDKGFFELEWPEYSRKMILSYFEQIEKHGYKVSIEAGASCWKNLINRYPDLGIKLKELWQNGKVELTNGTFSLPYALMSPLSLQYWQFRKGAETFKNIFREAPITYQCQENSLTPQMPELLTHFGYKRALHITQNHGEAPAETSDFICWQSPSGNGIPAMTVRNSKLSRKGNNYFFDLPLIHNEYSSEKETLNYINFQDLGYVPFRTQMIRAHKYASVWGAFSMGAELFDEIVEPDLESKTYTADDYKFSDSAFYPDATNVNSLSHYERVYSLIALKRQLLLTAFAGDGLAEFYDSINGTIERICLLEAHDCCYVQGQRRGEFHSRSTIETPPYSREELSQKIYSIATSVSSVLNDTSKAVAKSKADKLYNAAETSLCFGRLKSPELFSGKGRVQLGGSTYAVGQFESFSAREPFDITEVTDASLPFKNENWNIRAGKDGKIIIYYKGQKISVSPVDKKLGYFELLKSEFKKYGALNFASFIYQQNHMKVQSVILNVVFSDESDYLEINVKYSPRNNFDTVAKWEDYLALEFDVFSDLKDVWRFNPNVRSLTLEDKIASPYYLAVESGAGVCTSLMNEGASLYEVERNNGKIKWLFHAACETVHERRMAIAFNKKDAFQLSRAWGQGFLPVSSISNKFLSEQNWDGISVEDFVEPNVILISNLKDVEHEFPVGNIVSAENMVGENILNDSKIKLKPFELAQLIFNQEKNK